ncbi:MAG: Hsp20/alpha crystallin family protein [Saprospiraceae bacterium]|nr:Hsp20/alpha crystallin family protein [Saprospiraceae bacterium]
MQKNRKPQVENNPTPVNILEFDDYFDLEMALPGFKKEELNVEIKEGDQLTISGKPEQVTMDGTIRRREFKITSFERHFPLGKTIDSSNLEARFDNGILQVRLVKREEAKKVSPRTIEVF